MGYISARDEICNEIATNFSPLHRAEISVLAEMRQCYRHLALSFKTENLGFNYGELKAQQLITNKLSVAYFSISQRYLIQLTIKFSSYNYGIYGKKFRKCKKLCVKNSL